jgi:hypothetical protein
VTLGVAEAAEEAVDVTGLAVAIAVVVAVEPEGREGFRDSTRRSQPSDHVIQIHQLPRSVKGGPTLTDKSSPPDH